MSEMKDQSTVEVRLDVPYGGGGGNALQRPLSAERTRPASSAGLFTRRRVAG
jgi:hypothetical protein